MQSHAYGFPRLGSNREFKKSIESFWKNESNSDQLWKSLDTLQNENIERYTSNVDTFPNGELTLYDPMLDVAILCGLYSPSNLDEYYDLCRGKNALEMTKWFNTNYHYLVPEFFDKKDISFKSNIDHFALRYKQASFPSVIGPFTFLKLSKGLSFEKLSSLFLQLVPIYKELISKVDQIQIEEPAFVMDLSEEEISLIEKGYKLLESSSKKITLVTYYDNVDWIERLLKLPVSAIGLDFVRGKDQFDYICKNGFPEDKKLIAGLVDARNVWKTNIFSCLEKLKALDSSVKNLALSNAAPLFHLPVSLKVENNLDANLKANLSFAEEKLEEINHISKCFSGAISPEKSTNKPLGVNLYVQERVRSLKDSDFVKDVSLEERKSIQADILGLPSFPTTTIGSYPQTCEVRKKRSEFKKGQLSKENYDLYVKEEIAKLVDFQEEVGLDVFVHGEFERTDMVEFFAQNLDGVATTESGWIISYGTRAYRPPIIYGDISRPKTMTIDEVVHAQSLTKKPVKGMLTGSVTIIAWSFCREDIPLSEVSYQISLSLQDEIKDYEKSNIQIVQVDEAAFREKAPIKKKDWPSYFEWAVKSFNLLTNTKAETQIHTHMCYSEFGEIINYINEMDFDVISIEASRSRGDIIEAFEKIDFKRQIGLGVWDIHSPSVPSKEEIKDIITRSLRRIPSENFWINPDCGLKTRDWEETKLALKALVDVAKSL
ncbi:5-methyltetrahydropteroyltriglutamate--homocysteine S-methyltransferase [PVC group bacterium (ex Bugula neritina AB1)]|nr:5-methyltetrahydropteroyltriglutamate--homocysteine S-methyltransferase [PVC group bacterium (ex Bugula neritina AB1)]